MRTQINNMAINSAIKYKRALGILLVDLELAYEAINRETNSDNPNYPIIRSSREYVTIAMSEFQKNNH